MRGGVLLVRWEGPRDAAAGGQVSGRRGEEMG